MLFEIIVVYSVIICNLSCFQFNSVLYTDLTQRRKDTCIISKQFLILHLKTQVSKAK